MSAFKFISEFISKKENMINSVCLYALSALSAFCIIFWNVSAVDKIAIAGGAAVISVMFMINIKHLKSWQFYLVLLNMLSLMATLYLNKGIGLGVVLTAFSLIISITLFNTITFDKKAVNISRCIIGGAMLILFATSKYTRSVGGDWINIYNKLSGGRINNNSMGILIAAFTFLLVVLLKDYYENKGKWSLIAVGAITVLGMGFAYPFSGRIALAAIALFFVLLMLRGVKINTSLYRPICIAVFLLAVILPIAYIQLYHAVDNFEFMGKNFFTGREKIWDLAFEQIRQHPIFGSGTTLDFNDAGYSTQSAHNAMLGIWKNVGIIPLVTVVICFFRRRYQYINTEDRALFAFLVIMFTESFFMDSHFCFIFLVFMLRSHDEINANLPKTRFHKWIEKKVHTKRKVKEAAENDT